ncbi:MAG: T9SS type A sorting domain-containing protein [Bacteroidales bacterium]|nr:T9SS type A sorting domain-containing protein [Bacteroidales bacterium]
MPIREIDSLAPSPPWIGDYTPGTTCVFNDTVIVCGFSFISEYALFYNNFLIVIDTSGNKLSEIPLIISGDPPVSIERSYDDKLLVLYHSQTAFDNILNKFQPEVPYINNTYFVTCATNTNPIDYDFLCGHPISSDTITIHPSVITGIIGSPPTNRQIPGIEIWPNPGSQIIRVILSTEAQQGDKLFIINETGKFIKSVSLLNNSKEMNIDISTLPNGLYFAMHERKGIMLEKGKLIVER